MKYVPGCILLASCSQALMWSWLGKWGHVSMSPPHHAVAASAPALLYIEPLQKGREVATSTRKRDQRQSYFWLPP